MSHPASASTAPAHAAFTDLAALIDGALPQTQCTRCGYPDCASYAHAIAQGEAAINQCPPGGADGVARLAAITGHAVVPLSADHGVEGPRTVAVIDEAWCIGCTLCIKACPTDAIVGSNKKMHTVIEPYCTGCELCIPVCPVDCIQLDNASGSATGWAAWSDALALQAKQRYQQHRQRVPLEDAEDDGFGAQADSTSTASSSTASSRPTATVVADEGMEARKAAIVAAMERARQLREKGSR